MGHEELKEIGINAYGHRHKLIKGVERLLGGQQGKLLKNKEVSEISHKVSCEVEVAHFPSPGNLPNLGIKPRSPSLQADSLPAEPPGKPSVSVLPGI